MIDQYRIDVDPIKFKRERDEAFSKLRSELAPWLAVDLNCRVSLGGDSSSGDWSVVFEDGFWMVFIGERGNRYQVSFFTNVWDAVTYAGFRVTVGRGDSLKFKVISPDLSL